MVGVGKRIAVFHDQIDGFGCIGWSEFKTERGVGHFARPQTDLRSREIPPPLSSSQAVRASEQQKIAAAIRHMDFGWQFVMVHLFVPAGPERTVEKRTLASFAAARARTATPGRRDPVAANVR